MSFAESRLDPALQNAGLSFGADARRVPEPARARRTSDCGPWCGCPRSLRRPRMSTVQRLRLPRRLRVAVGSLHLANGVVHGIEHRQIVAAFLGRSIDQAVGVDRRIAPVGRDFVVQIGFGSAQSHCVMTTLRSSPCGPRRRFGGQFALRDPGGPVAELRGGAFPRPIDSRPPSIECRPGPISRAASMPARVNRGCEQRRDGARVFVAELMARLAAIGLDQVQPLPLALMFGEIPLP